MADNTLLKYGAKLGRKTKEIFTGNYENVKVTFFPIGRPCKFPNSVDPNHQVSDYIKSKMNVIDLIPCTYSLNLSDLGEDSKDNTGLIPQISYEDTLKRYRNDCDQYGLSSRYGGIRIYTTDDTTSADQFSNVREQNRLHALTNKMTGAFESIRQIGRSLGDDYDRMVSRAIDRGVNKTSNAVGEFVSPFVSGSEGEEGIFTDAQQAQIKHTFNQTAKFLGHTIAAGERVSFPTIWQNSSYDPQLTITAKLVSPYGHPKAIKEFIIRPLMHMLILSGAKTSNGVTYGKPNVMTLKAYGLNYTPLVAIKNISLRRGGAHSSFNVFRQPLIVDVTIDFDFLLDGFATFLASSEKHPEKSIFANSDNVVTSNNSYMAGGAVALPTLGKVVSSFQPAEVDDYVANLQKHKNPPSNSTRSQDVIKSSLKRSTTSQAQSTTQNFIQHAIGGLNTNTGTKTTFRNGG